MSARDLLDDTAVLGSDEDDESFDEGKAKEKSNGVPHFEDSSEEDDDDDEEEAAKVRIYYMSSKHADFPRLQKASLSTNPKKMTKLEPNVAKSAKSENENSARMRTRCWTTKILISLALGNRRKIRPSPSSND